MLPVVCSDLDLKPYSVALVCVFFPTKKPKLKVHPVDEGTIQKQLNVN